MAKTIAQRELRNDNARIMRAVSEGETFVITKNGVPMAELQPILQHRPVFATKAAIVRLMATATPIDAKRFRDDVDAVVEQGL
jgi:prevent-host-death family protein